MGGGGGGGVGLVTWRLNGLFKLTSLYTMPAISDFLEKDG